MPEDGATPIESDELDQLVVPRPTTRAELNALEQANIARARQWLRRTRRPDPLEAAFALELHRRMFGDTWKWAGRFRHSNLNIGIAWPAVPDAMQSVLANARFQLAADPPGVDDLLVRLHHRLVQIHPFVNGNGRFARLHVDLLLRRWKRPPFSWGAGRGRDTAVARREYLAALRSADRGDFDPLLRFVRS